MAKQKRRNNIDMLTGEQKSALGKFQTDVQTALPHMQEMARTAQALHRNMINAPVWKILDTPRPDDVPEQPQEWTVGHAKVNFVDHIKTEGAQEQ